MTFRNKSLCHVLKVSIFFGRICFLFERLKAKGWERHTSFASASTILLQDQNPFSKYDNTHSALYFRIHAPSTEGDRINVNKSLLSIANQLNVKLESFGRFH